MVALIKLIIVLVLSVFSDEPSEDLTSANDHHKIEYQYQKIDKLSICDRK